MSQSSSFELVLFVLASLGVLFSMAAVLRMMRSRAVIATRSQRRAFNRRNLCD